jgi:hypothetical protein
MTDVKKFLYYVLYPLVTPYPYVMLMPAIIIIGFVIAMVTQKDVPEFMWWILSADIAIITATVCVTIAIWTRREN